MTSAAGSPVRSVTDTIQHSVDTWLTELLNSYSNICSHTGLMVTEGSGNPGECRYMDMVCWQTWSGSGVPRAVTGFVITMVFSTGMYFAINKPTGRLRRKQNGWVEVAG